VRAMIGKDWAIFRSQSTCRACCSECCLPCAMTLVVMMQVIFSLMLPALGYSRQLEMVTDVWSGGTPANSWEYGGFYHFGGQCTYDNTTQLANISGLLDTMYCNEAPPRFSPPPNQGMSNPQVGNMTLVMPPPGNVIQVHTTDPAFGNPDLYMYNSFLFNHLAVGLEMAWGIFATRTVPAALALINNSTFSEARIPWSSSNYRNNVAMISAIQMLVGLMPSTIVVAARLVDEKREGLREHLRVMGCGDLAYLLGTYASTMLRVTPMVVTITVLFRILWWRGLDVFLLWLSFTFYMTAMTGLCLLMPVVFSSTTWTMVVMVGLAMAGSIGAPNITALPAAAQGILAAVFPNVAAWYAISQSLAYSTTDFGVPIGAAILALQGIAYGAVAQYLYKLFPGEYGIPSHPCACVIDEAAVGATGRRAGGADDLIVLENLRKFYGAQRESAAVNLSLTVKRGEILTLLGHNGSGKTTTLNILQGLSARRITTWPLSPEWT